MTNMTNWIHNMITFEDSGSILSILNARGTFDFNTLIPMRPSSGFVSNENMYWCLIHWGTELNAQCVIIDWEELKVYFDTAWSPPIPIFQKICNLFPEEFIAFEYLNDDVGHPVSGINLGGQYVESTSMRSNE